MDSPPLFIFLFPTFVYDMTPLSPGSHMPPQKVCLETKLENAFQNEIIKTQSE